VGAVESEKSTQIFSVPFFPLLENLGMMGWARGISMKSGAGGKPSFCLRAGEGCYANVFLQRFRRCDERISYLYPHQES